MSSADLIRRHDAAQLIRLLMHVQEHSADSGQREHTALRSIRQFLGASVAVRCRVTGGWPSLRLHSVVTDGITSRQQRLLDSFLLDLQPPDPTLEPLDRRCRKSGEIVTVSRRDLLRDGDWYSDPHVESVRQKIGVDDFLYSVHVESPGQRHALCLFRKWDAAPFDSREAALLDLFWSHAAGLLTGSTGRAGGDDGVLPTRLAEVLSQLHAGKSTKEIARALDLSPHTIYDHIKRLHRRFNAASRTELVAATQHLRDELTPTRDGKRKNN